MFGKTKIMVETQTNDIVIKFTGLKCEFRFFVAGGGGLAQNKGICEFDL